jgi:S-adenosylmethionine:tRNA ribosyltransferase-isomerase
MRLSDFDYTLPTELIAQSPAARRDAARLLVLTRRPVRIAHQVFGDIPRLLHAGDVLVLNDTRVIPARLFGTYEGGKSVEVLLIQPVGEDRWDALVKPAKHARPGAQMLLACGHLAVTVASQGIHGRRVLRLPADTDLRAILHSYGVMPLPPYIKRRAPGRELRPTKGEQLSLGSGDWGDDWGRYQTVYAREEGAVAAPTAGLHFTAALLEQLHALGVRVHTITLHVGPGTFLPVRVEDVTRHQLEPERYTIPPETAAAIAAAKAEGRRVIAVGTTSVRALEHAAAEDGSVQAISGETDLFITPGHVFRVVDGLVTNFHLPRSTLLILVSAFAGMEPTRRAYAEAIAQRYRFYSYGDAMLIL